MLAKILKIASPIILILVILFVGYKWYKQAAENTESPLNIIPTNAVIILQCNAVDKLDSTLNSADIWRCMRNISMIDSINSQIEHISNFYKKNTRIFKKNPLFISLHKVGVNNSGLLFSSNFERQAISSNTEINSLLGNFVEQVEYNNQPIFELQQKGRALFVSYKGNIVFFSENKMLVEDAIRTSVSKDKLSLHPSFSAAYKTIGKSADINLLFNYNSLIEYTNLFTNKPLTATNFSGWAATDISVENQLIVANGFSAINSSVANFTDVLGGQSAQKISIIDIIPENTSFLFAIGFDNAKQLFDKKNKILQQQNNFLNWNKHRKLIQDSNNVNYNEFINELQGEAGIFNTSSVHSKQQQYVFFKSKNPITASSLMQGLITGKKAYSEYSINTLADANITAQLFGNLFNNNAPYFTIMDDYFIFGSTVASLEGLIDNYKSENTLASSQHFSNYSNYFSSKSNLFFYINPGRIAAALKNKLKNSYQKNLVFNTDSIAKFTAFSLQMTTKKDLLLNNISLFYNNDSERGEMEKELALEQQELANKQAALDEEARLKKVDANISMQPQFVYNHFTKEKMIVVQNADNKIFAINSKGEQMWSLQIESKILGKTSSIDFYKNNKYQCLFNTASQLYLIDRNGKNVNSYPKLLPSTTSIGHALFDYNNTKEYRIMIVGDDNNIYNLYKTGKINNGWKYEKTTKQITQPPIHFIVKSQDFILNATNNSATKLLARNGTDRVRFKEAQSFVNKVQITADGEIYAITTESKLWIGRVDGSSLTYEMPNLHITSDILAYNSGYYVANENTITYYNDAILDNITFNLDAPVKEITTNEDYIAITTSTSLYLLKDNKIVEGFPIATDGYFNISDIDNNGKTNILNIRNGFIYNYELDN